MVVNTNEIKSSHVNNKGVPITDYTNPSIKIIKKHKGHIFLREG
jgi:hypothetical protein